VVSDRLSTVELIDLLRDVELHRHRPAVQLTYPIYEAFHSDGRYVRKLDRADDTGRFEVRNDQVCVTGFNPRCRYVYRSEEGALLLQDASDPTGNRFEYIVKTIVK
jgi:hypothetical protein